MKTLIAIILAFVASTAAMAQPAASARAASAPQVAALPPCWPSNWGGSGTTLQTFQNRNGVAYGWWCIDAATGQPSRQGFHAERGYAIKIPETVTGTLPQIAEQIWRENVKDTARNSPEMYALRAALYQIMAPTRPEPAPVTPTPPPPKQFRVMAIESVGVATGSARVSTLTNGALTAVPPETKTAQWGTLCDCRAGKFIAADQAFCPFGGQTYYVARCQLQ